MRAVACRVYCVLLLAGASVWATPPVRFDGFRSARDLSLVGDAEVCGNVVRLTAAGRDRSGAAWLREKQPAGAGFDTTFQFQLTQQGGLGKGADGFAFVIQNAGPGALGGRGSAGGFAVTDPNYERRENAIPWSIAVFFDTFRNEDAGDPSANYVAVVTNGKPADSQWPARRLAFTKRLPVHLKDRKVHTAHIVFQPPVLSISLDDVPVLESIADFSVVLDAEREAWVGFTASTGGGYENHDILNWSFSQADITSTMVSSHLTFLPSACLPDRNLCTPEKAVTQRIEGGYHVVLPGNREWGASIPTPPGREVQVKNAQGIVCWDLEARGTGGCSGPSGNRHPAGAGFVVPEAPAGALILKNAQGRTWFSVNGRSGAANFDANEGFYEFDVTVE